VIPWYLRRIGTGAFRNGREGTVQRKPAGTGDPGDLIAFSAAAKEIGSSRQHLARRIRAEGVPVWLDPLDQRYRLVRRGDLARFMAPRLVGTGPVGES